MKVLNSASGNEQEAWETVLPEPPGMPVRTDGAGCLGSRSSTAPVWQKGPQQQQKWGPAVTGHISQLSEHDGCWGIMTASLLPSDFIFNTIYHDPTAR